jgi:tetratricopeptide (TPR) repeat protein
MAGDQNKFKTAMIHAERFSEQGNWPEASKAYRFALAEFPNNEMAIIGFARANMAIGQTEVAWKALQQALKVDPGNYEALVFMADIQEQMGQADAAAETYLRVGNVFAGQSDTASAIEAWTRAIELVPDKIDAHQKLAQALAQQGKTRPAARQLLTIAAIYQGRGDDQSALQQLQEAQILLPDDPAIVAAFEAVEQGLTLQPEVLEDTLLTELEMVSEFAEEYREDDFLDEEDPFALETEALPGKVTFGGLLELAQQNALTELAGVIFEEEGQQPLNATLPRDQISKLIIQAIDLQTQNKLTEAINNYRQVTQAGVGRPALYFNMGMLFKQQGQYNEAAKMFKMSAQEKAYQISSQFALGETYYAADNLELALRHFLETLKIVDLQNVTSQKAHDLTQIYDKLTNSYLNQMDPQKAASFVTALQKFFANPNWQEKAAEARARMDSVTEDSSTMSLAEFLETPETEVVITTMALTGEYIKRNLLLTASEECLRSIQKAPLYLPLHVRLADILLKQEHTEEAITKYLHVSRVYLMRQQPDQAVNLYQKVLRLAPMDVTVRSKLIELYTSLHQEEEALEQYLILADAYYQLAQVDRSLERYNEALRLATHSSNPNAWKTEILSRMGDIYNQRFDWARATTALEDLLKLNPNDERTQRQLVELYYKQNKASQATKALDTLLATYQKYNPLKALDLLKELASIYPEDMPLRQRLAVAFVQNGMNREAIAEYDALGEMQMENGLRAQAMQTIQAIINLGPDDVEGYRRLLAQISGGTA